MGWFTIDDVKIPPLPPQQPQQMQPQQLQSADGNSMPHQQPPETTTQAITPSSHHQHASNMANPAMNLPQAIMGQPQGIMLQPQAQPQVMIQAHAIMGQSQVNQAMIQAHTMTQPQVNGQAMVQPPSMATQALVQPQAMVGHSQAMTQPQVNQHQAMVQPQAVGYPQSQAMVQPQPQSDSMNQPQTVLQPSTSAPNFVPTALTIGQLVEVSSRTYPGINKPGGRGTITKIHYGDNKVDVKYVLGGYENFVELAYVQIAVELERRSRVSVGSCSQVLSHHHPQQVVSLGIDPRMEQMKHCKIPSNIEFLLSAGKIFARHRHTLEPFDPLNPTSKESSLVLTKQGTTMTDRQKALNVPLPPLPLSARQIQELLKLLGPNVCLALPWLRLPFNPRQLFAEYATPGDTTPPPGQPARTTLHRLIAHHNTVRGFLSSNPEMNNPFMYNNSYRRAPPVPVIKLHQGIHFFYPSNTIPDGNVYPTRNAVSSLSVSVADVTVSPTKGDVRISYLDPIKCVRDKIIRLEKSLSGACLLDVTWGLDISVDNSGWNCWKRRVEMATYIKQLSSLLVELTDATCSKAFVPDWYSLKESEDKDSGAVTAVGTRQGSRSSKDIDYNESSLSSSSAIVTTLITDDWNPKLESERRKWDRCKGNEILRLFNGDLKEVFKRGAPETKRGKARKQKKESDGSSAMEVDGDEAKAVSAMSNTIKEVPVNKNDENDNFNSGIKHPMESPLGQPAPAPTETQPTASSSTAGTIPSISLAWQTKGRMVSVQRRMGPGQNCPGGIGHIEKVHTTIVDTNANAEGISGTKVTHKALRVTHVDVKYIPSEPKTRDKSVPIEFVTDHHDFALEIQEADETIGETLSHQKNPAGKVPLAADGVKEKDEAEFSISQPLVSVEEDEGLSPKVKIIESSGIPSTPAPSSNNSPDVTKPITNPQRKRGCGKCETCLQEDCRECINCRDMKKYGGSNRLRQKCILKKKCPFIDTATPTPAKEVAKGSMKTPNTKHIASAVKKAKSSKKKKMRAKRESLNPPPSSSSSSRTRRSDRLNIIRSQIEGLLGISDVDENENDGKGKSKVEREILELKLDRLERLLVEDTVAAGYWTIAGML